MARAGYWNDTTGPGGLGGKPQSTSSSTSQGVNQSTGVNQSSSGSQSGSYIPNYSQTPILENIAQYAEQMAPQVYQWGMQQYANNQGNINGLMDSANSYASAQRQAADMGMAEAGVQQGAEAGRQSAIRDLQSYGIDPSSGRYAELDQASRVQSAAAAAGAGNQQRMADVATGNAMKNQAVSASLQNANFGNQVGQTANAFLGTGMQLKYSPLGTNSASASNSSGYNQSSGVNSSRSGSVSYPNSGGGGGGGGSSGGGAIPSTAPGERSGYNPDANSGTAPPTVGGRMTSNSGSGSADFGNPGSSGSQPFGSFGSPAADYGNPGSTDSGGYGFNGGSTDYTGPSDNNIAFAEGGPVDEDDSGGGGNVPSQMSPSGGEETDDIPAQINETGGRAQLNADEFVVPQDVAKWKGQEFFYKLIAQSRSNLAQMGGQQPQQSGYGGAM